MKSFKKLFAVLLSVCMITALTACEAPAGGGDSKSPDTGASEPAEVKTTFNNKVEVTFAKIGTDTLGIAVIGNPCKNLVKKSTFEDSGKEFAVIIGEEKTITVPREQFADYGIEEEDEEVVSYDIDVYEPYTQMYLYSLDSNLMVLKSGDDWESYRCEFNDANTGAGAAAYFTKITAPGLCDKVKLEGTYRVFLFDKDKEDLTEEYMIAEGDAAGAVKTMDAKEFEDKYENPAYTSMTPKHEATAPWVGEWVAMEGSEIPDATLKVEMSYTGVLIWTAVINGETRRWYGEENEYTETQVDFYVKTKGGSEVYNIRNGAESLIITYITSTHELDVEHIEYRYDIYGDNVRHHIDFVRKP